MKPLNRKVEDKAKEKASEPRTWNELVKRNLDRTEEGLNALRALGSSKPEDSATQSPADSPASAPSNDSDYTHVGGEPNDYFEDRMLQSTQLRPPSEDIKFWSVTKLPKSWFDEVATQRVVSPREVGVW